MALMLGALPAVAPLVSAQAAATPADAARFDSLIADAKAQMLVDPVKTVAVAQQAQQAAEALDPSRRAIGVATARWLQGEAWLRVNRPDKAGPLIEAAYRAVEHSQPVVKLNGDVLLSRGGYHTAVANVSAALSDYQEAFRIYRSIGETRSQAIALLSIAGLYQDAKDYENALRYYAEARDVYNGDPALLVSIYNNRGDALKELGRFDEAEAQFREALGLARTMHSPVLEAQILRNIAREQLLANRLDAADRTIQEVAGVAGADDPASRSQYYAVAAQAALQHGNLTHAAALIERSFDGVDPTQTTLSYRANHQTAFAVYSKLGQADRALVHLEALKRLDDEATKLAASTNTALMAARFDFANQELKITRLQAEDAKRKLEYERSRARTQRLVFAGVASATLIIISMLGFGLVTIRRSRDQVRAANVDLEASNTALAKALAAKTEFLATTSHEIRTPLNGILGMTQVMLADRKLDAATRDRINVVHGAGTTMRALVDDILDVAKMETGNMTVEHVAMDLPATLTEVSRLWQEQAIGRGLTFDLDLGECPHWVKGDPARLRQVVFNLLSNALKFIEQGRIGVHASCGDDRLRIAVSDTGIGIPADKLELIFESFRQAEGGTTRKFGGTGLGLAICRNLARAMGGDVSVASAVGAGTTFTIDLPLERAEPPAAAVPGAGQAEGGALLILDKSPITRAMLRTVLQPHAGEVAFAGTPDEATEALAKGGIALLLIDDNSVKGLDDLAANLAALAATAHGAGAEAVLLWASPSEEQREAFAEVGIDRVLGKPIAGAALAAALYPQKTDTTKTAHLVSRAA